MTTVQKQLLSLITTPKSEGMALALIEENLNDYHVNTIIRELVKRDHPVISDDFPYEDFDVSLLNIYDDDKPAKIGARKSYYMRNREEAIEQAKELGLELPKECKKHGVMVDGRPKTLVEYNIITEIAGIEAHIDFHYTREGLPSNTCKVVSTVNQEIVCTLD